MPILYLNEILTSTFQIIALGSFFIIASKFVMLNVPAVPFSPGLSVYRKRIAPEKISLSRQKTRKRKF